jgi:hypothetical protein
MFQHEGFQSMGAAFAAPNQLRYGMTERSRVEKWRGGLGGAWRFAGSFVCRRLTSLTMLRFHFPLIEPDRRISRIRLSDKDDLVH